MMQHQHTPGDVAAVPAVRVLVTQEVKGLNDCHELTAAESRREQQQSTQHVFTGECVLKLYVFRGGCVLKLYVCQQSGLLLFGTTKGCQSCCCSHNTAAELLNG